MDWKIEAMDGLRVEVACSPVHLSFPREALHDLLIMLHTEPPASREYSGGGLLHRRKGLVWLVQGYPWPTRVALPDDVVERILVAGQDVR